MHTNENTKSNYKNESKLQAMLAEYNALTSEYRDRMKIQHNLLQIHVTVLTAVIGVAFSKPSTMLLLIPIESSIFGIWYFDIAITMLEIGTYIRDKIETKIQTSFDDKYIMGWEDYFNGKKEHSLKETTVCNLLSRYKIRHMISLGIAIASFIVPVISLFIYLWLQGNNIFKNDITYFLIICDIILLIIFLIVVGYYILKSLKIGQEYRNEKHTVTNEIQQS